jgi:hypothetical protein
MRRATVITSCVVARVAAADPDMPGMDMSGMQMTDHSAAVAPLDLPMSCEASGTAWQPDATPMAMHMTIASGWTLMLHYVLQGGYDWQGNTPRGHRRAIGLGWVMGMATHELGGGYFTARAMLSPEPFLLGERGYPLLLQSGEEVNGVPLFDRQHPHDLFMETAVMYSRAVTADVAAGVYVAPAGEPALGPVAYPHRPFALYDMVAALGHHWEDSTHISFGVVTAVVFGRAWKLDGSWFNGREPDQFRYDFDLRVPDSYSARFTVNPTANWSGEISYGYLASPEQLTPTISQQRLVASITYAGELAPQHHLDVTAVLGHINDSDGVATTASLIEANLETTRALTIFGRAEVLEKTGDDLGVASEPQTIFGMGAITLGAAYELPAWHDMVFGVGAAGTVDLVGNLADVYGTHTPLGGMVYALLHPSRAYQR